MSFIFRAYHAMARQRPMSTKSGLPTAAIFVFVNMLRKLREDFSPEFLAAVFDVGGPTFRDEQAEAVTTVRKFDIKTQTFTEVEYKGYKANRTAMPEDLVQQVPYIRRALEAYRIPILELKRFEADDLIGTLARKAAEASHPVYVVSSDKDMMQLVNDTVQILNPPKDNLICDAAKVEEILGVPPERVVDVMALRGDAIDNIPGAPGIGDKGSVEIIRRFGTVEQALERAAEVEKKTYRESLQNNRDTILFSKSMATIDTNVPVDLDVEAMRAGAPDVDALRELFTELEFTSLLKELLPVVEVTESNYGEAKSAADVDRVVKAVAAGGALAVAIELKEPAAVPEPEEIEEEPQDSQMSFLSGPAIIESAAPEVRSVAISAAAGTATIAPLDSGGAGEKLRAATNGRHGTESNSRSQGRDSCAGAAGDHACRECGMTRCCTRTCSIPPTRLTRLAEVALRRFNLKLSGGLAESADITGRLTGTLRGDVEAAGLAKLYEEMDLPLVPVLARMEAAGVKIDTSALAQMSTELEREAAVKAKEIYEAAGMEFNVGSPKQLGDVLFNRMNLPEAGEIRQGTHDFNCSRRAGRAGGESSDCPHGARLPSAHQAEVDLCGCAAAADQSCDRTVAHDFRADGNRDGTAVVGESEPAEYSDSNGTGARHSRGVYCGAGTRAIDRGLFADRVAVAGAFLARPAAGGGIPAWRRHSYSDRFSSIWRAAADGHARSPPAGQGRELRHCLRALSVRTLAATWYRAG